MDVPVCNSIFYFLSVIPKGLGNKIIGDLYYTPPQLNMLLGTGPWVFALCAKLAFSLELALIGLAFFSLLEGCQ